MHRRISSWLSDALSFIYETDLQKVLAIKQWDQRMSWCRYHEQLIDADVIYLLETITIVIILEVAVVSIRPLTVVVVVVVAVSGRDQEQRADER